MRSNRLLAALAVFAVAAACADEPMPAPEKPTSRAASKINATDLRKAADDPRADRADRVAAVFALFANHLKPPCGPAAIGEALGEAKWLTVAKIYPFHYLGGWIPVECGGDGTAYSLHVFPITDDWGDSVIYLRLTGGAGRSADDLRAFLHGEKALIGRSELVEFALCYPSGPKAKLQGRIEHFGPKGLRVMFDDH